MSDVEVFMESPLLSWLESCLVRPEILSSYSALFDGSIVHSVVLQIDPEPQHHPTKLVGLDGALLANARAKNFDVIVRNLRNLYEEELGQYILRLPDCALLGHRPDSKEGTEQMRLLLTLLLGAAVQCPSKEVFISRIKELDVDTQHGIVEIIKQVTDDQTLVLTAEMKELVQQEQMYTHLLRIMKERDVFHSKWIGSLATEQEMANSGGGGGSGGGVLSPGQTNRGTPGTATTPSSSGGGGMGHSNVDPNHAAVELADFKSKLRRLRQELEEKSEAFIEVKEELDHKASQYEKLRTESHEWFTEAKRAAAYRDEVDILRERAERADRFEMEIQKLREKLGDSEFYKSRVEELREDNRMLMETKDMVEEQLLRSRKRSDQVMILEAEIIKYKQKLNDLALEMDIDKSKLQELVDENTQLQLAAKGASLPPVADAGLSEDEEDNRSGENSLSEQLTNNAQTRALKLELENRRLNAALEALKESAFKENANKILELEKDKKRLSLKVEQLQENCNRLVSQNNNLESVFQNALDENKKVQDALDARKQTIDRQSGERETDRGKIIDLEKQVETVGKEKQRVQNLSESIQRRADELERSYEAKARELEALQPKIVELEAVKTKYDDIQSKISVLEKENGNLLKDVMKLRESLETKDVLLDENGAVISNKEREIQTLARELEDRLTEVERVKELEKQYHELISQRQIDLETIGTLQENLVGSELQMDKVKQGLQKLGLSEQEVESSEFNVEVMLTRLVKNPETFKTVKEVVLSVGRRGGAADESDGEDQQQQQRKSSDMCVLCHRKEIYTVEKNIEFTNENEQRRENGLILRVPLDKISSTEVNNLKVQCDRLAEEKTELSASLEQMKTEMARHKVEVSTLNSQVVSLNTQQIALQVANSQLVAEKDALLKQLDIMRHQSESMSNDQLSLQFLHDQLTSEYETLNGEKENMRTTLRDLRVENRDLRERLMAAEKTRKELRQEIDSTKTDAAGLSSLKQEHSKLKDDFRNLFTQSDRMKQEYKNMQEQYRAMRSENGQLKLQHTELQGELNNRIDVATGLDIDLTKVSQRCEMLLQMNANLDSDRRTLMDHVSQLLSQYHELLVTSLDDKQHYHDEEKLFTDRVNNLHRQKEKLEDKIMEHYRKLDSCSPKKKAFASTLVKRVRKAGSELMSKVPSRQNRRSWIEDPRLTQSQNLGSESGGNDSDNSLEEPSSLTESRPLNRHSNFRQSLQRKPADLKLLEASLVRGGAVRSSLHTLTSNNNTSTPTRRVEKPAAVGPPSKEKLNAVGQTTTDVANVVNLGGAGSRRTVYLDEMQIKTEPINNRSPSSSINMGKAGAAAATSASSASTSPALNGAGSTGAGQPAGDGGGSASSGTAAAAPTTLLMYNRISNIISPLPNEGDNNQQQGSDKFGSSSSQASNANNNNSSNINNNSKGGGSLEDKEKESAIWYEYGCV